MPENTLTKQSIVSSGLTPAYAAANTDGSKFVVDSLGRLFLHVKNTNAATRTVTIAKQKDSGYVEGYGYVAFADIAVVVGANTGDKMIGPIAPAYIDDDGYAHATFSAVADLTIGLFELTRPA